MVNDHIWSEAAILFVEAMIPEPHLHPNQNHRFQTILFVEVAHIIEILL